MIIIMIPLLSVNTSHVNPVTFSVIYKNRHPEFYILTIGVLYAGTSVRHTECPPLAVADKRTVIENRFINRVPMTVSFLLFIG